MMRSPQPVHCALKNNPLMSKSELGALFDYDRFLFLISESVLCRTIVGGQITAL